jgi:hypothetical protein
VQIQYRVSLRLKLGDCTCFFGETEVGKFCNRDRTVYIGIGATEEIIEKVLNHETLHHVLRDRVGKVASKKLDKLFIDESEVGEDGFLKESLD